ncbi:unnamed protein product [Acanthoscelides obtectus]|uniref:Uncharacterized protein n=1 Tax=Acanthoscelides obtectus TaxID=200917 RepID=A0A9P0KK48_ACAOB|nr:unnamed protein product [Acanthoscelides obtectus]CAK1657229.1 hypothetical protein AOBTE_LOCUS20227 [Acanthoscelides obtectus]
MADDNKAASSSYQSDSMHDGKNQKKKTSVSHGRIFCTRHQCRIESTHLLKPLTFS